MEMEKRKKIIIDTDPGVDDAVAIFLALQSPEVDVIGLTTIYGNVYTTLATKNALHLLEVVGREDIPVAEGSHTSIKAIELNPLFQQKIGQIVILGGAFSMNGHVNPAAETNIFGDPEAADIVFTCGADTIVVGINVTHQVVMTDKDLEDLASSNGKCAKYLCKIMGFYLDYHLEAYNIRGIYLHDPTAMFAAINPLLMTYEEGVVRVQTEGICRGLTILDNMKKRWGELTEWSNKPSIKVAVTVDADKVVHLLKERLKNS